MKLFLSYAAEDKTVAEQIYFALLGVGHELFFDRASLPPGGDYNERVRDAIDKTELFIFLISGYSTAADSYALTELHMAQQKWAHPKSHVLPVMISPTKYSVIPNYLKAVTLLEPQGNLAAETVRAVSELESSHKSKLRSIFLATLFLFVALGIAVAFIPQVQQYLHSLAAKLNPSDIAGAWTAEVIYDWPNAKYQETFTLKDEGGEVHGTASFLGINRAISDGKISGDTISFSSKTQEVLGDENNPKASIHRYQGKVSGETIQFVMQTEGGFSEHLPVEFTAHRNPVKAKVNP